MGKIKETRFRIHPSVLSSKTKSDSEQILIKKEDSASEEHAPQSSAGFNLFSGIDIDVNKIAHTLLSQTDTASISGKSTKEIKKEESNLSKKEKIKRRHERFMQKLDMYYANKKKKQSKVKKSKNKDIGDMEPLLLSLPDVPDKKPETAPPPPKHVPRPSMKLKKRTKQHLQDVKHFRKVLGDPVFKKNPAEAIRLFLQQKLAERQLDVNH